MRAHFSPATYARLFIPEIFETQSKVLFIDADTIINADVSELLEVELGNNLVAAVKDIVMEGFVRFGAPTDASTGHMPANRYLSQYLGLDDPNGYFQAGLIVFNLDVMHQENTFQELMKAMERKRYWFLDQDIMNFIFQNRILYLPMKWNVFHGNGNVDELFPGLKFSTYIDFLEARKNPCIVHYAGENKPWDDPAVDFSDLYWRALRETPWFEQQLSIVNNVPPRLPSIGDQNSKEEAFRKLAKRGLSGIFPTGTKRRNLIARYYFILLSRYRSLRSYRRL